MPRNTREWAQRQMDMSEGNIKWAQAHLLIVSDKYKELHPEISDPLDEFAKALEVLKKAIVSLRMSI